MRDRLFSAWRVNLGVGLALLAALNGCSVATSSDETEAKSADFALTTPADVLGFESTASWTASSGTVASSSVHAQGSAALSLSNFSYSELVSTPIGLNGVTSEFDISVRPPATPGWGELQILLTSATLGLNNAWVGQASLQGLAANQFSTVSIALPANIQQALGGNYSDLRIKVVLNVPYSTSAWILDDLHFKGSSQPTCGDGVGSPYTIAMSGEDGVDPAHVEAMRCTFFTVYPLLVQRFNPEAATTVGMIFTDTVVDVAGAIGDNVYYNKSYLASAPLDSDVVVHETMHVVQLGYTGEVPGWILEGTADFVRDEYGLNNAANGWSIPTGYAYGQNYQNGYGDAAAFFKWIDANYRQGQRPVVDELDDIMRLGQYSDQTWVMLTGHTVDDLWQIYSNHTAPVSAPSGVTIYRDSDFSGDSFTLAPGSYESIDLNARAWNDAVNSLRIPAGHTVTVYTDDLSGASAVYTSDVDYVGDLLSGKISSIVIQ